MEFKLLEDFIRVLAKLLKFLKDYEKYCIAGTYLKLLHSVKYQLVFAFAGKTSSSTLCLRKS